MPAQSEPDRCLARAARGSLSGRSVAEGRGQIGLLCKVTARQQIPNRRDHSIRAIMRALLF
jgi:hypothetical protein